MSQKDKPNYTHGCSECRFLGTDTPKLNEEKSSSSVDMYVHSEDGHHVFWRRYGDDEDDVVGLTFSTVGGSTEGLDPVWIPMIKRIGH